MKKIISYILLASILTIASLYGIISMAVEDVDLVGGATPIAVATKKAYSFQSSSYTRIGRFPIDEYVFNSQKNFFCAEHHVEYGGKYFVGNSHAGQLKDTNIGDGYHVNNTATKHKWDYTLGVLSTYATSMTADVDTTADYYIDASGNFIKPDTCTYIGYKESTESPEDSAYTNWWYTSYDMNFDCESGDANGKLAFLLACYMSESTNNTFTRGYYGNDPLQSAVWDYFGQLNKPGYSGEKNFLEEQGNAYMKYHSDSANPNVDVTPDDNVGTTISGTTYTVGPFKMSNYVRAQDYSCPKVKGLNSEVPATLQEVFGTGADVQGTIIDMNVYVSNGSSEKKINIKNQIPEPNATFNITLNASDIDGYDELTKIEFTYQRIHASGNGTKYIGKQWKIIFKEVVGSSKKSSCSYSCPSPASGCSASTSPGTTSDPYTGTCTHKWYSGCWTTYDGSCSGCRCPGHTGSCSDSCPENCTSSHSYTCSGCECPGTHPVHHHGTYHETTHTVTYLCPHGHKDCKEFKWEYSDCGEAAQDGFAGSGVLVNEIKTYTITVSVPLKTNMKIYKYISEVKHNGTGGRNISVDDRSGDKTVAWKNANSVKLERGDTVTYKIELKNTSRFATAVKVKDVLPSACSRGYRFENLTFVDANAQKIKYTSLSGATNPAGWIEVPANNTVTMTVKLDPLQYSGTFENKVEFITTNSGSIHMRFVHWGDNATHGPRGYNNGNNTTNIVNIDESRLTDSDFYTIKEYDLTLDKYITEVKHETNNVVTYSGTERKQIDAENNKKNDPVYAEYGDVVTYKIDIYNTKSPYLNAGNKNRKDAPFWDPDIAYVDITDTLPKKYSKLSVVVSNNTGTITTNNSGFKINNIKVPYNGITTVTVTLVVEEHTKATLEENNVKITPNTEVRNVNNKGITNHSAKTTTSDWYKINDYNLTLDKYISNYKHELTDFNNTNKFTNETNTLADRYAMTEEEKKNAPMQAEKDETIVYSIRLTNDAVAQGKKKATQVRPTKIQDKMDAGLEYQSVVANVYKADGSVKFANIPVTHTDIGNNTHTFEIGNKFGNNYLILDPTDYIIYEITVKVTKTNMYLYSLENTGSILILTDINHDQSSREVKNNSYNENIAAQQVSKEYVKLKDLVIAGRVWLDRDKDGYMGKNGNGALEVGGNAINVESTPPPSSNIPDTTGKEYAMQGITVKLYKVNADGSSELFRTTKTDSNGMFTFSRQEDGSTYYAGAYTASGSGVTESEQRVPKAEPKDNNKNYSANSTLINYYIEYQYDGLMYKSTEIYSDNKNISANGEIADKYKIDSNALEFKDVRDAYNQKYEIISFNKGTRGDGSEPQQLEYDKQNHNSYLLEDNTRYITARSFITEGSNSTDANNTKFLWLYKQSSDYKPETEYLKYINLGLEEREDVNIKLTQDVYDLTTYINGEQMNYEYNQNNYTLRKDEVLPANVLSLTDANKRAIDKEQEQANGAESDYSKSFNTEHFITGYKNDTGSVDENKILYKFEYYLEDYNYRISQYHADTVRYYKGSANRNYDTDKVNTAGDSILVANQTGRESELNTQIQFRIKVTNEKIENDEPYQTNKDIAVYTGINEIVEYYDTDFVNVFADDNDTINTLRIKKKGTNDYLEDYTLKVSSAKAIVTTDGVEKEIGDVILSAKSEYNTERTLKNGENKLYDTLYIRPKVSDNVLETIPNSSTGQLIKAGNFILGEGDSMDVLVTFTVEKTADTREVSAAEAKEIMTILGTKENVAEISAYSTYYKTGENSYKPASLVDKNSNPGNFGEVYGGVTNVDDKEYIKYFEDDTFKTGITLTIPTDGNETENRERDFIQRTLTGFVWDDARSEEAKDDNGTQYIGNGIYTEGHSADKANDAARRNEAVSNKEINDITVQDVKTELIEIIRMPDPDDPTKERIYEDTIYVNGETGDNASVMTARTDANGKYKFSGYIPGEYIVRFGYGDDASKDNMLIFNGQDYKSTTYQGGEAVYAENATENSANNMTAKDVRLQILEKANTSDAKDDEIRRLEVIGYSETMNNNKNEILKGKDSSNKTELINNTSMFADTIDFLVRPEKKYEKVTVLKFAEHNKIITETTRYARFKIENIDFGLQYRPELQLTLNKYISNITVTTSDTNGTNSTEPLVDAYFDAYYGVVKNTDYITGATDFVTDDEGNVIEVQANDTVENIENKLGNKKGLAQKNNDGTYVIAVAGTKLNENSSIGLQNVQYLPNEYIKDNDGNQVIEEKDGKYLVKSTQGFAYIVVDDNLLQGSIIKVKYLFTGTNISEIDRIASNLSDLRFKENREVEKYTKTGGTQNQYYDEYTYQVNSINEKPSFIDQHYSAARTARNALFSEYFRYELDANETDQIKKYKNGEKIVYQVKAKDFVASDSNKTIAIQDIKKNPEGNNPHSGMTGYYGRYLGSTYYTGKISPEEVVAEIKLDKVLDYIDNDLVFNNDDNRAENNLWKTTTSKELHSDGLLNVFNYTYFDANGKEVSGNTTTDNYKLLDADGRAYDTDERSNLALSLDDRVRDDYTEGEEDITVNKEFSKFLLPRYSKSLESFGTISLSASKVLSPEDKTDDMTYENIAEIIQYTSVTGRITNLATTIGNAKIEDVHRKKTESPEFYEGRTESDTASVERVTLTPPTGLSSMNQVVREVVQGASYTVLVIIVVGLVCVGITVGITLYHKRRIK
ncbi:MAG: hypothetical protein J6A36_05235 [Clostridia bacterium]|nr:hypothetical protein [Clostridia bacterium]